MILLNKKYYDYTKALFFLNFTPLKSVISSFEVSVTVNLCLEKVCESEATLPPGSGYGIVASYLAVCWNYLGALFRKTLIPGDTPRYSESVCLSCCGGIGLSKVPMSSAVRGPAVSASPGNLLEVLEIKSHPRPIENQNLYVHKTSREL